MPELLPLLAACPSISHFPSPPIQCIHPSLSTPSPETVNVVKISQTREYIQSIHRPKTCFAPRYMIMYKVQPSGREVSHCAAPIYPMNAEQSCYLTREGSVKKSKINIGTATRDVLKLSGSCKTTTTHIIPRVGVRMTLSVHERTSLIVKGYQLV